jgi:hypothetical protein
LGSGNELSVTLRKTLLALWLAVAAVCILLGPVARSSGQEDQRSGQEDPGLTIRHFCQTEGGFAAYLAIHATGFPPNSEGEFRILLFETPDFYPSGPTDARGALESSIGWGLAGLDDPLVGRPVEVTLEVASVSVTETVTLTCDPAANAPTDRNECAVEVFRNFFSFLGFPFRNEGDCIAFVASGGKNDPGTGPTSPPPPPPDADGDGFSDELDNCVNGPNADQSDRDNDGLGDACDSQDNRDDDGDGVQNFEDQCPGEPGPASNNGCPLPLPPGPDRDGDHVPDDQDQCPDEPGPAGNNGCPSPLPGRSS